MFRCVVIEKKAAMLMSYPRPGRKPQHLPDEAPHAPKPSHPAIVVGLQSVSGHGRLASDRVIRPLDQDLASANAPAFRDDRPDQAGRFPSPENS